MTLKRRAAFKIEGPSSGRSLSKDSNGAHVHVTRLCCYSDTSITVHGDHVMHHLIHLHDAEPSTVWNHTPGNAMILHKYPGDWSPALCTRTMFIQVKDRCDSVCPGNGKGGEMSRQRPGITGITC